MTVSEGHQKTEGEDGGTSDKNCVAGGVQLGDEF